MIMSSSNILVMFEVLTAVRMSVVTCVVTPCGIINGYHSLGSQKTKILVISYLNIKWCDIHYERKWNTAYNNDSTYLGCDVEEIVEYHFCGFCGPPALPPATRSTQFCCIILQHERNPHALPCIPSLLLQCKIYAVTHALDAELGTMHAGREWRQLNTFLISALERETMVNLMFWPLSQAKSSWYQQKGGWVET